MAEMQEVEQRKIGRSKDSLVVVNVLSIIVLTIISYNVTEKGCLCHPHTVQLNDKDTQSLNPAC